MSRDWRDGAACTAGDWALFFGTDGELPWQRDRREARARAICARCPVRKSCLRDALAAGIQDGVWGGLSERDLRKLTRPALPPAVVTLQRKRCRHCDTEKPASEFAVARETASGLSSWCLACKKEQRDRRKAAA